MSNIKGLSVAPSKVFQGSGPDSGVVTQINWRCYQQHSVQRKDRTNCPARSSKIHVYLYTYMCIYSTINTDTEREYIVCKYCPISSYIYIQSIFPSPNSSIELDVQGMASSPCGKQHDLPAAESGCGKRIMTWNHLDKVIQGSSDFRPKADTVLKKKLHWTYQQIAILHMHPPPET